MQQTQQQAAEAYTATAATLATATADWETARQVEVDMRMAMNAARTAHEQAKACLVAAALEPPPAVPAPEPFPTAPPETPATTPTPTE